MTCSLRLAVGSIPLSVFAGVVVLTAATTPHLSMAYMPGLGGARIAAPPMALLMIGGVSALLIGLLVGFARAGVSIRTLSLCLTAAPMAYPTLRLTLFDSAASGLGAETARVADVGTAHFWALLSVAALLSGFALALAIRKLSEQSTGAQRLQLHWRWGGLAAALGLAWVALILGTSTGIDAMSSWGRWGACGVAMLALGFVVLASGGRTPSPVRDTVCICFSLVILVSLWAQREYVEALGADVLLHTNPWLDCQPYTAGLREIASAVEPRESLGPLLSILPWLILASRGVRSRVQNAVPGVTAGLLIALFALGVSHRLDANAAASIEPGAASSVANQADMVRWSRRVLPRTVPWIVARHGELESVPSACLPEIRCDS